MSSIIESKSSSKIAVLAGSGQIPHLVYSSANQNGWTGCVIQFQGFSDDYHYSWNTFKFPIGKIGSILKKLNEENITDIVICGGIERGKIKNFATDIKGIQLLTKVAFKGDDGAIRVICEFLEKEGFKIHKLSEFLNKSNVPIGHFGGPKPNEVVLNDIKKGIQTLNKLSIADIGQSVVVQNGLILAVEAIEGTDEMIKRSSKIKFSGEGPVLVKSSKIGQELKIDQPVIGSTTIKNAKNSNFSCVACEAENVLIIDFDKTLNIANKEKISLFGFIKEQ